MRHGLGIGMSFLLLLGALFLLLIMGTRHKGEETEGDNRSCRIQVLIAYGHGVELVSHFADAHASRRVLSRESHSAFACQKIRHDCLLKTKIIMARSVRK